MEVVPPPKDFQIVPIGHKRLNNLVDLLRFLRLPTPTRKDDVRIDPRPLEFAEIALIADETGLFGVLQVVPVALVNLAVDRLLHPNDFIDQPFMR